MYKNLISALLLFLLLMSGTVAALAQARIIDLSGNGVPDVEIVANATCNQTISGPASGTTTVRTDAEGKFYWPQTLPGLGSLCALTVEYNYSVRKEGYRFTRTSFKYRPNSPPLPFSPPPYNDLLMLIHAHPSDFPTWRNVSAASYAPQFLASEMIASGFGTDLAGSTVFAQEFPSPTTLALRRVVVLDSTGAEKAAKLLFVSPTQFNYVMPEGVADGSAAIKLVDENGNLIRVGLVEIKKVVPGIFTANATGDGAPMAVVVRVQPDGTQAVELVARFDETERRFVPLQIDMGPETEFLVLSIFGTGWRQQAAREVKVSAHTVNSSVECPLEYVGKQPTLEGIDQINARLPRTLIGKGEVILYVNFRGGGVTNEGITKPVTLNFK
jgi:uncharacterized protein (TIGR03437 family)